MTAHETSPRSSEDGESAQPVVLYECRGPTAVITMNRPKYRNAQNSAMTYALDSAFERAVDDDDVRVLVLAGAGEHFSAGHDIGTPGRDVHVPYDRKAVIWWGHTDRAGADARYARDMEVYLGMCRRSRILRASVDARTTVRQGDAVHR
jgi:enoyl-CoA hydratase/carnithine racemase